MLIFSARKLRFEEWSLKISRFIFQQPPATKKWCVWWMCALKCAHALHCHIIVNGFCGERVQLRCKFRFFNIYFGVCCSFFCALSFVVPLSLGCVVTLELVADLSAINHLLPHSEYMTLCLIMAEIIFNFSRLNSSLFIRVLEIDQVMFRRWIHFYFNSFQTQKQSNIMKYATKKRSTHRYYPIYQWHSNKIR